MSCKELDVYFRLPSPVVSGHGDEITLEDGRTLLDLYGGHCVNTLGAGEESVLERVRAQWSTLSFTTNMFATGTRDEFLDAYARILPDGEWRVFLSNSGAEANENALKVALSATGREKVLCFDGAFHGRTASAEAVTDTNRRAFPRTPFEVVRIPFGDIAALKATLDETFAGAITEPIQSMAGVVDPPAGWLEALREACTEHGVALCFDEVQTGNGRLGTPFASQSFGVVPDVFTTAKGAAAGLPIGITVISEELAMRIGPGLFGSTFGGGPTVLSAATHVANVIAEGPLLENVAAARTALEVAARNGPVVRTRGRGLLMGLELEPGVAAKDARDALFEAGCLVGTSADPSVLRVLPPLTLNPRSATRLATALENLEVKS